MPVSNWTESRSGSAAGRCSSPDSKECSSLKSATLFLSADLGITLEPREDHAAYIGSWLKALRNYKRAIFYRCCPRTKSGGLNSGMQHCHIQGSDAVAYLEQSKYQ
jgi:antirestriction protein ArdC